MNSKGEYTDRRGDVLRVGMRVTMVRDEPMSGQRGGGTITSLPPEGNDYHTFPVVQFDHDGARRHVADCLLWIDRSAYVIVTNRYGTFRATPENIDDKIREYLPASVADLRRVYAGVTESTDDVSGVTSVTELLVMIENAEKDRAKRRAAPSRSQS